MSRQITQRELRNESGRIMRALDRGKAFIVTRNGVPVGEQVPLRQRVLVPANVACATFAGAPRVALRPRAGCGAARPRQALRDGGVVER